MYSTDHKSKRSIWGLLLVALITILPAAWVATSTPFGTMVSNGEISFTAPDAKAGENMADILNKADKKAERKEKKEDKKDNRK
ncbi:MAG: hypothetical protein JW963_23530 [Anaerolineales bacterium]|nr:hypothetical protein [Anaerolineales bacterium]